MVEDPPRLRDKKSKREGGTVISPKLRDVIVGTSFVLWVGNNVLDAQTFFEYEAVQSINAVFLLVAGAVFAFSEIQKRRNGGEPRNGGGSNGHKKEVGRADDDTP
jgi:hypothetical protein